MRAFDRCGRNDSSLALGYPMPFLSTRATASVVLVTAGLLAPLASAQSNAGKVGVAAAAPSSARGVASTSPSTAAAPSIAFAADAASSAPQVNESHPAVLVVPTRSVAGWGVLWQEFGKGSIDLRIALDELERAEAATRIAWGGVLPTATASVSLTHVPASGTPGTFTVGRGDTMSAQLSITAPLINLRNIHAIGTARVNEEIAALSISDVRRRVAVSLARQILAIASAEKLANLNRVNVEAAIERLGLTRRRLAAGVGDARDLVRAQQDLASARAQIPSADESLRQAREGLAVLLGESGELGIGGDPQALEQEMLGFCGSAKSVDRPEVMVAKKQVVIAERNVDDILLKFAPTLSASANLSAAGPAFNGPFSTGWSVGAVLTIPLYDGGVRYGEKRDRVAQVDEARARVVQLEVSVSVETAQARRAIAVAEEAQIAAREARDLAREADRLARLAYSSGAAGTTNFDLIDAGRQLRNAEEQLLLRELDLAKARVSLPFVEGRCEGVQKSPS
jgi:outer membrane protein TolC